MDILGEDPNMDGVIGDGFSARTGEGDWDTRGLFPGSEPFFFTGDDGAMVFKSIVVALASWSKYQSTHIKWIDHIEQL